MPTDFSPQSLSREFQRQLSEACPRVEHSATRTSEGEPMLTIPPKHPDVGGLSVWFYDEEITVGIGELFHWHFECMHGRLGRERSQDRDCIAEAVEWLRLFLEDAIVLEVWEDRAGGTAHPKEYFQRVDVRANAKLFTWSGPWPG